MALDVYSVTSSSTDTRSTATITVMFGVPENDDAGTDSLANGFAALHFPAMWGMPFKSCPTSASLSMESDDGSTSVFGEVDSCSMNTVYLTLDASYTWTDGANYTLSVSGVPTPEYTYDSSLCGEVLLSIGTTDSGSYAWSDA